ncbi:helix-turn-helix transcriptional regulator [Lachnospiraceae bacterium 46-61]
MKISNILENSNISLYELSKQTGVEYSTLHKYRRGVRNISVRNAKILGKYFGIDWWLFFENENERGD